MHYFLTEVSTNRKTGPIPVATISKHSCPPSCPLIGDGGCYAEGGPLRIHWNGVTDGSRGYSFDEFLKRVRRIPRGQIWRYGQAGDLPGEGEIIDKAQLLELAKANAGRPVIAFTHKRPTNENLEAIKAAAALGFQINLSADDLSEADLLAETGLPVVTVLPAIFGRKTVRGQWAETLSDYRSRVRKLTLKTPKNLRVAVCPATYSDTRCSDCRVCSHTRKGVVIGFPAHGNRKSKIGTMDTS